MFFNWIGDTYSVWVQPVFLSTVKCLKQVLQNYNHTSEQINLSDFVISLLDIYWLHFSHNHLLVQWKRNKNHGLKKHRGNTMYWPTFFLSFIHWSPVAKFTHTSSSKTQELKWSSPSAIPVKVSLTKAAPQPSSIAARRPLVKHCRAMLKNRLLNL